MRGLLQSLLSMAGAGLSRGENTVFYRFHLGIALPAGYSSRLHCQLFWDNPCLVSKMDNSFTVCFNKGDTQDCIDFMIIIFVRIPSLKPV